MQRRQTLYLVFSVIVLLVLIGITYSAVVSGADSALVGRLAFAIPVVLLVIIMSYFVSRINEGSRQEARPRPERTKVQA